MAAASRLGVALSLAFALAAMPAQADLPELPPEAPSDLEATYDAATRTVQLAWQGPNDADGFNVYRNGVLVQSSAASTFTDAAPAVGAVAYDVRTRNENGESPPASALVLAIDWDSASSPLFNPMSDRHIMDAYGLGCDLIIIGLTPSFPYVAQIDDGCLPPFIRIP